MSKIPDDRPIAPASPCINVCVLGAAGYCIGCLRTGDEIARWREMSAPEQWRLIEQLGERRAQLATARVSPPDGGLNES
jgi:predicted Fe-S protein YdhL (DUF1289 family)